MVWGCYEGSISVWTGEGRSGELGSAWISCRCWRVIARVLGRYRVRELCWGQDRGSWGPRGSVFGKGAGRFGGQWRGFPCMGACKHAWAWGKDHCNTAIGSWHGMAWPWWWGAGLPCSLVRGHLMDVIRSSDGGGAFPGACQSGPTSGPMSRVALGRSKLGSVLDSITVNVENLSAGEISF